MLRFSGGHAEVSGLSVGLLSLVSVCDVSSLLGSNALWTTTTVGKAFCKSTDGTVGRSIACTKGKIRSQRKYQLQEGQRVALSVKKWPNIVNLPLGH